MIRLGLAMAALGAAAAVPAAAQMQAPPQGSLYRFDCTLNGGTGFVQEYRVQGTGNMINVAVTDRRGTHTFVKPYFLNGTTMAAETTNGGEETSMSRGLDDFKGLAQLKVGWREKGWVTERRGSQSLNWHYTVAVTGEQPTYNEALGDVNVFVIEEERWVDVYSSFLYLHYSPQVGFPIYWEYTDSNKASFECKLTQVQGPSPTPAPQPQATMAAVQQPAATPQPAAPQPAAARPAVQTQPPPAQPSRVAALPKPQSQPAAPSRPAPADVTPEMQVKLERLDKLLAAQLITQQQYEQKRGEIMAQAGGGELAPQLAALNRKFRQQQITAESFVVERAKLLATLNGKDMPPEEALLVAKELFEQQLISQIELTRKRQEILDSM